MKHREGWSTLLEVQHDISARFSPQRGREFSANIGEYRRRNQKVVRIGVDPDAEPALLAIPLPFFFDAIEEALSLNLGFVSDAIGKINELFEHRGIYYRVSDKTRQVEWSGDRHAYSLVIQPVLESLRDSRLDGAREEFKATLNHLRKGTSKDLEDSIEESAKSVESVMKVLVIECGIDHTGKETAKRLFDLLKEHSIIIKEAEYTVLGASKIRNAYSAHGSGSSPREIPLELAELACRSAAAAVTYLATALP